MPRPVPEPRPAAARLTAAEGLTPYHQGAFDALCGLYAIINAIRLVLAEHRPLSRGACERLFDKGILFLHRHGKLRSHLNIGMSLPQWRRLTEHLCWYAGAKAGMVILIERPLKDRSCSRDPWQSIEDAIISNKPVLLLLAGTYWHYTVIAGYSERRITLHDSSRCKHVERRTVAFGRSSGEERHRVPRASVMALSLNRTTTKVD